MREDGIIKVLSGITSLDELRESGGFGGGMTEEKIVVLSQKHQAKSYLCLVLIIQPIIL